MKKILFIILVSTLVNASQFIVQDVNKTTKQSSWIALPYVFSSESMGFTAGVVGIFSGFLQPQLTIVATAYRGSEQDVKKYSEDNLAIDDTANATGFVLAINGYRPWFSKRMFVSFLGSYAYYPDKKLYLDGGNDSTQNLESDNITELSPLRTQGYNNFSKINFDFVLPIGDSKNQVLPIIKLQRGIATNRSSKGGGAPFVTGQTLIKTEFFYTNWTVDKFTPEPSYNSNGIRISLEHDNTDYKSNPSRGYTFNTIFSADFGVGNSTQSWNSIEVNYSQYIELNNFSWTRHNVIAMHAWSAYSPSWDKSSKLDNGVLDSHQTPMWEGARLGGWNRLRAYDSNRFNDKAGLYFGAEYRIIPQFNPMKNQKWSPIPIDWFQAVVFAEAGRVAPEYNIGTLFSDMKYDVGFSLRALAAKVPVRFEMAYGEEGSTMWVMLKQPF